MAKPEIERQLAESFRLVDIFIVNGAMQQAEPRQKEAWERVRAKLIQAADIKPPRLVIPPEMVDEDGFIKPTK